MLPCFVFQVFCSGDMSFFFFFFQRDARIGGTWDRVHRKKKTRKHQKNKVGREVPNSALAQKTFLWSPDDLYKKRPSANFIARKKKIKKALRIRGALTTWKKEQSCCDDVMCCVVEHFSNSKAEVLLDFEKQSLQLNY